MINDNKVELLGPPIPSKCYINMRMVITHRPEPMKKICLSHPKSNINLKK